ncbi:unnamed protein product [Merluccius merluccius]
MKSTMGLLSIAVVLLLPGLSKAQEGETIGEVMKELQTTKSELLLYKAKADDLEKVLSGAYFFRFNAMDGRRGTHMGVTLYKNHQKILHNYSWNHHDDHEHVSNGVVLELYRGDVVSLRLPQYYALFDFNSNNFNIFSGFLLFPM